MKTGKQKKPLPQAMAFYHPSGLPAAWNFAAKFAGPKGRLATMPDIITGRLNTNFQKLPWTRYFNTLSAEYFGLGKNGNHILIVAHGIGPMSTLDGVLKAYSWEYKDTNRQKNGGRITQREFLDLEAGKYGEVSIVDLESYCRSYQYPFLQELRASEALIDPVIKARLGSQTEQFIREFTKTVRKLYRKLANNDPENRYQLPRKEWHDYLDDRHWHCTTNAQENSDPYIITVQDPNNCSYYYGGDIGFRPIEKGYAIGHLLSTGALYNSISQNGENIMLDVGCFEWWNGVRLVGILPDGDLRLGISWGPDADRLLEKQYGQLFIPAINDSPIGLRGLIKNGQQWFTEYPKAGERMDTGEPEYLVSSMVKVGRPALFRTTIGGYHGLFKYGINEIQSMTPPNANAYSIVNDPQIEYQNSNPTHHTCLVQFFQITADTTQRLMRAKDLWLDYDLMMRLMNKKSA